jgi:hypothetical protein
MPKPIRQKNLFLPELVEEKPGPWHVFETNIRESAVDLPGRKAWVPRALTRAQRLARLHELGHVKYTPRKWRETIRNALAYAEANGEEVDPTTVLRLSKMLEENRIDWLLWDRHGIDLRPAREALDWAHMQVPIDPLTALQWTFQLAWTVWASRGLGAGISNPPPVRPSDPDTANFFDACWAVISNHHPNLAAAMVRGCVQMYTDPSHESRDRVAAELSTFFPPQIHEPEQPKEKPEEQQAQREEQERVEAEETSRQQDESGGVGGDRVMMGHYEIHDHTTGIRRPSMRIARREVPQFTGTKLAFPHRYMLDKAVFARRLLTEGGIMIDGSGSMNWTQRDMDLLLEKLPAVTIGIYGGVGVPLSRSRAVFGRICILAKRGRFSTYDPAESGFNSGNDVDLEALWLLARWPKPRFWLSDGYVCGGKHTGPHPNPAYHTASYIAHDGLLVDAVNRFIRAHEILRVSTREDMHRLVRRQRVTLYRSCINRQGSIVRYDPERWYPREMVEQPVSFQL